MSLVALSATHRPSPLLAARRARRAGASSSTSSLGDVASNRRRSSSSRLRATGEVTPDGVLEVAPEGLPVEPSEPPTPAQTSASAPLACPVSLTLLDVRGASRESGLQYAVTDGVWDLTLGAAVNVSEAATPSISDLARSFLPRELRGLIPTSSYLGTSTFETPQVAFAYERGWRDSFKRAGFPGPDEEFALARAKLLPHASGKVLVDASCGSGLFTRRFAKSGEYGCVVALDFSDAMLRQARQFAVDESLLAEGETRDDLVFVRADIARLPFPEGSVAGVHAGAAIHCWPEPRSAVADCARPGTRRRFLRHHVPYAEDPVRGRRHATGGGRGGARGIRRARGTRGGSAGVQAVEQTRSRGALRRVRVGGFRVRRPRRVHLLRREETSRVHGDGCVNARVATRVVSAGHAVAAR